METQLTYNEMENIGRTCRKQQGDTVGEFDQLSFTEIEHIEKECRQLRSDYMAELISSLYRGIGTAVSAVTSVFKTGMHRDKLFGASAR